MTLNEDFNANKCDKRDINFGIMYSGGFFHKWQEVCIKEILSLDNVQLSLLIIENTDQLLSSKKNSKIKDRFSKYSLFRICRDLIFRHETERPVNIEEIVKNIPSIECRVVENSKNQFFAKEDIENLNRYNLDFILRFGFDTISGDILDAARYGVWSFCDDEQKYIGAPPFFWEVYENKLITGVVLQRLTNKSQESIVLRKGYLKTSKSYSTNINGIFFTVAKWPAQVVKDILNSNDNYLHCQSVPKSTCIAQDTPIYTEPTNFQMIFYFLKLLKKYSIYKLENHFLVNQWNIGFICEPFHSFLEENNIPAINWLPQKKNRLFVADPFAIIKENKTYVFCEVFDYLTNRGEIATFDFNSTVPSTSLKKLDLNVSCHLSYPCLFEYKKNTYLIPESSEAGQILLYKAVAFPDKWERVSIILNNIKALDCTIFHYQNIWWLAYTDLALGMNNNLCFLYALDPLGEWKFHDLNPVKIDIRSCRSAGAPFVYKGELYRPSQDCSERYGGKITINKVKKLTPNEFDEDVVRVIEPDKSDSYSKGRHTLSLVGDDTIIIDGHRSVFIGNIILNKLFRSIEK